MVRLFSVSLLAMLAGLASAIPPPTQEIMNQPVHSMEGWSYSDCGSPTDVVQLKSISLSPDPPKPGQDLTITAVGTAQERVEDGAYADVVVKLGLIRLLSKTFDVCEEARNANATIQCPIEQGEYTVVQTVALPKEIPQAKFTVAVKGYTVDDEDMLCLDLKVDFMKNPFPRFGW
ncbi:ML domain-containing protein [Suillus placidus]|uniref:Phosphatidylglycerol/phosphatidylinositol transfer protein n=1 Tax=Suillus placidus TaxID=48579 RepID=A0A9P7A901_9AGAM|nr:ML domain-containing protein [Suillus placidus]